MSYPPRRLPVVGRPPTTFGSGVMPEKAGRLKRARMAEPAYTPSWRPPGLSTSSTPNRRWIARLFRSTYGLQESPFGCDFAPGAIAPDSSIVSTPEIPQDGTDVPSRPGHLPALSPRR